MIYSAKSILLPVAESVGCDAQRQLEVETALVILPLRRRQVEFGKRHFVATSSAQIEQRIAHDRIVRDFHLVTVLEDENGVRLVRDRLWLCCRSCGRRRLLLTLHRSFLLVLPWLRIRTWARPTAIENRWSAVVF